MTYNPNNFNIALYNGEGTWEKGRKAIKNFLDSQGYRWKELSADNINNGTNMLPTFDLLWIPGGYAAPYIKDINENGLQQIRDFVNNGGRMIGLCAGQYFLADRIVWEGERYDYPLGIFKGEIGGSLHEITPWDNYVNTQVNLSTNHPINEGFPNQLTMVYYGGGEIVVDDEEITSEIGSYQITDSKTISTFKYGNGHILMLGPHPEIGLDEHNNWVLDGTSTAQWDWLGSALKWLITQKIII